MVSVVQVIMGYITSFVILFSVSLTIVLFIRSRNSNKKIEWMENLIIILSMFFVSLIDIFLVFSYNLRSQYEYGTLLFISRVLSFGISTMFFAFVLINLFVLKRRSKI